MKSVQSPIPTILGNLIDAIHELCSEDLATMVDIDEFNELIELIDNIYYVTKNNVEYEM
jgi:hypothetical protein